MSWSSNRREKRVERKVSRRGKRTDQCRKSWVWKFRLTQERDWRQSSTWRATINKPELLCGMSFCQGLHAWPIQRHGKSFENVPSSSGLGSRGNVPIPERSDCKCPEGAGIAEQVLDLLVGAHEAISDSAHRRFGPYPVDEQEWAKTDQARRASKR